MANQTLPKSLPILLGLLLLAAGPALAGKVAVKCLGDAPTVTVTRGESSKEYYSLAAGELVIPLEGPGKLTGFAKRVMGGEGPAPGVLRLAGVPGLPPERRWTFKPSGKDAFDASVAGTPSGGKKLDLSIPAGKHELRLGGDPEMLVLLYWEGPKQPLPRTEKAKAEKSPGRSPWDIRKSAYLNIGYDDNIIHYSEDLIDEYVSGPVGAWFFSEGEEPALEPEKYRLRSYDDIVVTPRLALELRRKFWDLGQTRFKVDYRYTRYLYNPIKDVKNLRLVLRQVLPGAGRSLELIYSYTPEKYIRQLTDRPPYAPSDDPRPWVGFRFTGNDWMAVYRHRLHKKVNFKLQLETGLRYYNKPFLEQDLADYEAIGQLDWTLPHRLRLSTIYGAARGWTRRRDTVEEEALTSDDNDNSYTQDRYRVDLLWRPRGFFFSSINLRYQLRIQYFTSPKLLWDDPFHVGRKDVYNTYRITASRKLTQKIGASYSIDYSERILNSPYTGDISEGMNYDNLRFWIDLSYRW